MNEVLPGETESTEGYVDGVELIDELIDLAATKHIEETPEHKVYTDETSLNQHLKPDKNKTIIDHGNDSYDVHVKGAIHSFVCLKRGEYWNKVRAEFEYISDTYQIINSYEPYDLVSAISELKTIRDILRPSSPYTEIANAEKPGATALQVNNSWVDRDTVSEFTEGWNGHAVQAFRGVYIDRIPWILCGHTLMVQCLIESLDTVFSSYRNLQAESLNAAQTTRNALEVLPNGGMTKKDQASWNQNLAIFSGVAAAIGGAAAAIPTGGTSIAAAAGLISGAASIASGVVDKIDVTEPNNAMNISGETAVQIMDSFEEYMRTAINISTNSEEVMAKIVQECHDYASSTEFSDVSVPMSIGEDIRLNQRQAYFCPATPELASKSATSHGEVESSEFMGPHEHTGHLLAVELSELLKVGHEYVPNLASNFGNLAGKDVTFGLSKGLTHLSSDGTSGKSALFGPWNELNDLLNEYMSDTESNLNLAADVLVLAAESFAERDEEAAAKLRESSEYF